MNKKRIGDYGELLARVYLEENQHEIISENYRTKQGEVDIISRKAQTLHFVEVKTMGKNPLMEPREKVNKNKQKKIREVANEFVEKEGDFNCTEISFDVIEIAVNDVEGAF